MLEANACLSLLRLTDAVIPDLATGKHEEI